MRLPRKTVRVDAPCPFAVRVTETGLRMAVGPLLTTGLTVAESVIFPVKPLTLVRVTANVPEVLCVIVKNERLAEMAKSGARVAIKPTIAK